MPFDDGSGILVISHTNDSVNRIRDEISEYCPRLFLYPNFIGTIQGFVDQFLAIPFYINRYGIKPYRIDNEVCREEIEKYYKKLPSFLVEGWINNKSGQKGPIDFLSTIRFNDNLDIVKGAGGSILLKRESNTPAYKIISAMKNNLLKRGLLYFDEAYCLANEYLIIFPELKKILQRRFRFVFIDETQDMSELQCDVLEKLFHTKQVVRHCYQTIGDRNQAIYNEDNLSNNFHNIPNRKRLSLKGSHRFNQKIADVVKYFGTEYGDIKALSEPSDLDLNPHIILFDEAEEVLPKFTKLIKDNHLSDEKYPFYGICWTTHKSQKDKESHKIRIQDYYPLFEKDQCDPNITRTQINSYLKLYNRNENFLAPIRRNLIAIFLKILREEAQKDENDKYYTERKLLNLLKGKDLQKYEEFKLKLFQWSSSITAGKDISEDLKKYIISFLHDIFGIKDLSDQTDKFINIDVEPGSDAVDYKAKENDISETNIHESNGIKVLLGTVHSVKGRTHTATLYMESFYQTGDNYESVRLAPQFAKEKIYECDKYNEASTPMKKLIEQSARVVYVGFSRPTDLLCFAVHRNRIEKHEDFPGWEVIR